MVDNYDENALNIFEKETRNSLDDYKKDLGKYFKNMN